MTVEYGGFEDERRTATAVRPATEGDLDAIVAIYNDVLETSSTIWSESPTTIEERRDWLAEKRTADYPVLVAEEDEVLGFIAAGPFRPWQGYAKTAEHSIHVHRDARNRGVGGLLLGAMERALRNRGTHVMVAGIDAANDGSIRFHVRAGFAEVARMPEVGRHRGAWRDLVLVQKQLV
jgi:L-amino acid N-acyltransferase YncA